MIGAGCPHLRTVIPLALVCALALANDAVARDQDGAIMPHRATYKIEVSSILGKKLKGVWPPRPVGAGTETIELRQTCHGWRYRETVSTTMKSGARPSVSRYTLTWFEGSDGRRFTFEERRDHGAKTEKTTATASIARGGQNDAVIVDKGKRRVMTLPDGTIFPMTFLRRILSAARNGDEFGKRVGIQRWISQAAGPNGISHQAGRQARAGSVARRPQGVESMAS